MTTLDILILIWLGIGIVLGLTKGLVKQVASIVGLVAGLLVARALYTMVGEQLAPRLGTSVTVAHILSFLLIWIAVPLVLHIVAVLLTKALDALKLGWANRWLGAAAGLLVHLLWIGVIFNVLALIHIENAVFGEEVRKKSLLYEPSKQVAGLFFPTLQDVTEEQTNEQVNE